jgi:hypothetical protein
VEPGPTWEDGEFFLATSEEEAQRMVRNLNWAWGLDRKVKTAPGTKRETRRESVGGPSLPPGQMHDRHEKGIAAVLPWLYKPSVNQPEKLTQRQMVMLQLLKIGTISRREAHIMPEYGINCVQLPVRIWELRNWYEIQIDTIDITLPSGKKGVKYELRYFDLFGNQAAKKGA